MKAGIKPFPTDEDHQLEADIQEYLCSRGSNFVHTGMYSEELAESDGLYDDNGNLCGFVLINHSNEVKVFTFEQCDYDFISNRTMGMIHQD